MSSPLAQLYVGPLQYLTPPAVGQAPTAKTVSAHRLAEPAYMAALLERFSAQYAHGDRRALASLWSKWHFSALIGHGLAASLLLGRELPLSLEALSLTLSPAGQTTGFQLAHAGQTVDEPAASVRFATLLDGHLAPLIATLATVSGASPRVFWSNAGSYVAHFAEALETHPLAVLGAGAAARALMAEHTWPDGRRNPLYQPVRQVTGEDGAPRQVRRVCCLRYRLEELDVCGNCPLACRGKRGQAAPY